MFMKPSGKVELLIISALLQPCHRSAHRGSTWFHLSRCKDRNFFLKLPNISQKFLHNRKICRWQEEVPCHIFIDFFVYRLVFRDVRGQSLDVRGQSLGRFKSVLPLLLVKNGYFLPLLLDFCTILFNPLNKNRGKLSNSLNNFSVGGKQILVWQGTVPLAGFTSRVFRWNLSQFHNVEQVEHYIIYLCMPTFMKMAIIPIVQRMILGV